MLFLDLTGFFHTWFGWMARIQFLPALLALNVGVVIALVALTLVLGRVYCSVICPLGIMQDGISWISGRRRKKRYRFSYSPARNWLRYGVLGLFVIAMIAGIGSFVALLAPYSSFGRIVWNLLGPVYEWGNNLLAKIAAHYDSYAFYEKEVWIRSIPTFVIAAVNFVAIAIPGVAQRPHILQHHLSCGNRAWCAVPLLVVWNPHRQGQMRGMRPLLPTLQVILHRRQEPPRGLQPLRGLHGLHRHLHAPRHNLRPTPEEKERDGFRR